MTKKEKKKLQPFNRKSILLLLLPDEFEIIYHFVKPTLRVGSQIFSGSKDL